MFSLAYIINSVYYDWLRIKNALSGKSCNYKIISLLNMKKINKGIRH